MMYVLECPFKSFPMGWGKIDNKKLSFDGYKIVPLCNIVSQKLHIEKNKNCMYDL